MYYDNRALGDTLAALRREKGLSQETLSGLAGMARSHLAEIETGKVTPTVETLWRIAEALGAKPSEILKRIEA